VALPAISEELDFTGSKFAMTSSLVLTIFLIGYAGANIFGGIFTRKADPKWIVIILMALWSIATFLTGFIGSLVALLVLRTILGISEGIYWPQQSRFAKAWFAPQELTRANTLIQYYGQFFALALGFFILTPIYDAWGWRSLFYITGAVGIVVMIPLYWIMLKKENEAPYYKKPEKEHTKLTLKALGGKPFILLAFSYLTQAMLFWGITLWLPMVVKSLGYTGMQLAFGSALPYIAAIVLAVPMSYISDRTGKRILIATLGLFVAGILLISLPFVEAPLTKLILITIALGYYASSFTPNLWSILQSDVEPAAIGPAAGIINGIGAGGGGVLAGFIVGILLKTTGSYIPGYVTLGFIVISGAISLVIYGKIKSIKSEQ
jgi:MFS family permease